MTGTEPRVMDKPEPCPFDYDDEFLDVCGNIGCEDGWVADCIDGFCINAEDGCALCLRRCEFCNPRTPAKHEARRTDNELRDRP